MYRYRARVVLGLLVAVTACGSASPELTDGHAVAIRDSVRQTLQDLERYSAAGLWDSAAAVYADTSALRWVEDGAVRYRSGTEVREALAALGSTVRPQTAYEDVEITPLAPGLASVVMGFTTQLGDSLAGGFSFGGMITMTLVHRPEGWRILNGHTSTPSRFSR